MESLKSTLVPNMLSIWNTFLLEATNLLSDTFLDELFYVNVFKQNN